VQRNSVNPFNHQLGLQTIRERIERYRREQDGAKVQTEELQHTQSHGSSMSPSHPYETTFPTHEQQYSPDNYTNDDHFREDVGSPTGRSNSTQKSGSSKFSGRGQSVSSSTSSLASGGRESGKPKSQRHSSGHLAEVKTKKGTLTTYIQKPPVPLNAKEKPHVIIKHSEGNYEMGTLMYIGAINQKIMAGVHLDLRMPSMLLEIVDILEQVVYHVLCSFLQSHPTVGPVIPNLVMVLVRQMGEGISSGKLH